MSFLDLSTFYAPLRIPVGEGYKFVFGRPIGMCRREIWKKSYQSVQFWAKFWAKSPDLPRFSDIWANFGSNFGKIWKFDPFTPNSAFYKGSFIYQEADFATHVGGTSTLGRLNWVPPPAPDSHSTMKSFQVSHNVALTISTPTISLFCRSVPSYLIYQNLKHL